MGCSRGRVSGNVRGWKEILLLLGLLLLQLMLRLWLFRRVLLLLSELRCN